MVDKNQKWPHTPKNGVDGLTDYKDFLIHHVDLFVREVSLVLENDFCSVF